MFCEWTIQRGVFVCRHCGHKKPASADCINRRCVRVCGSPEPASKGRKVVRRRTFGYATAEQAVIDERLAICRACTRYVNDGEERCLVFVERGKEGLLMHPKGVSNPRAKCPDGRWSEVQSEP